MSLYQLGIDAGHWPGNRKVLIQVGTVQSDSSASNLCLDMNVRRFSSFVAEEVNPVPADRQDCWH
jgi:hypothetical protein